MSLTPAAPFMAKTFIIWRSRHRCLTSCVKCPPSSIKVREILTECPPRNLYLCSITSSSCRHTSSESGRPIITPFFMPQFSPKCPYPTTSYSRRSSCVSTPQVSTITPSGISALYSSRLAITLSSLSISPRASHSLPSMVL